MKRSIKVTSAIILLIVAIVLFSTKSKAAEETTKTETWTDFSKAKVSLVLDESQDEFKRYSAKLTDTTVKKDLNNQTILVFTHNKVAPNKPKNWNELTEIGIPVEKDGTTSKNSVTKYIEENGDLYCWILEGKLTDGKFETGEYFSVKVERPKLNGLGKRMSVTVLQSSTTIFLHEASEVDSRKANIKIGKMTDNNILLSIKNSEANCLQKLMDYAKKSTPIYTAKDLNLQIPNKSITDKFEVVNGAYYYVYMEMQDEKGKYYPVEDVWLYQGLVGKDLRDLAEFGGTRFKWNLADSEKNNNTANKPTSDKTTTNTPTTTKNQEIDKTTAQTILPKTGTKITKIVILLLSVSVCSVILIGKVKKYKGIE